MLYVLIPCLILLIVAIVLKKRESENKEAGAEKGKKATFKKTNKKILTRGNRSSNAVPTATHTSDHVKAGSTATPLDPDFKHSIEQLIKAESYFSAEAKINQALNQDNSQHELYLYLFDIHLAQKDEFATRQLINYLRSLGLHKLADQAEIKQQSTATTSQQEVELSSSLNTPTPNVMSNSDAAFDALMNQNSAPAPTSQVQPSFDLNLNDQPIINEDGSFNYVTEKKAPAENLEALDFQTATTLTPASDTHALEVKNTAFTAPSAEVVTERTGEIEPLEFNFDLASQPSREAVTTQQDFNHHTLNFNTQSEQESQIHPLNEKKSNFEFDLEQRLESTPHSEFDFKLDTPTATTRSDFADDANAFNLVPQVNVEAQNHIDPLAQSFPELITHNEIQLNLDLAKKYIQLGAYAAATRLLNEKADQYSIEQRAQSKKLLNQIAS